MSKRTTLTTTINNLLARRDRPIDDRVTECYVSLWVLSTQDNNDLYCSTVAATFTLFEHYLYFRNVQFEEVYWPILDLHHFHFARADRCSRQQSIYERNRYRRTRYNNALSHVVTANMAKLHIISNVQCPNVCTLWMFGSPNSNIHTPNASLFTRTPSMVSLDKLFFKSNNYVYWRRRSLMQC